MLNCLDSVLEDIVKRNSNGWMFLLEKPIPDAVPSLDLEADIQNAKTVLRVTTAMLKNSVNKDIYNSSEVSVTSQCLQPIF